MRGAKPPEPRHQPGNRESRRRADRQLAAAGLAASRASPRRSGGTRGAAARHRPGRPRSAAAPVRALEQPHATRCSSRRTSWLTAPGVTPSSAPAALHAEVAGGGLEGAQGVERRQGIGHPGEHQDRFSHAECWPEGIVCRRLTRGPITCRTAEIFMKRIDDAHSHDIGVARQIGSYSDGDRGATRASAGCSPPARPGLAADGTLPADITGQAELAWTQIVTMLEQAQMTVNDLVKVTQYLLSADISAYAAVRSRFLGTARPAFMLLVVPALVRPNSCSKSSSSRRRHEQRPLQYRRGRRVPPRLAGGGWRASAPRCSPGGSASMARRSIWPSCSGCTAGRRADLQRDDLFLPGRRLR